jgi:hypothetical protein
MTEDLKQTRKNLKSLIDVAYDIEITSSDIGLYESSFTIDHYRQSFDGDGRMTYVYKKPVQYRLIVESEGEEVLFKDMTAKE